MNVKLQSGFVRRVRVGATSEEWLVLAASVHAAEAMARSIGMQAGDMRALQIANVLTDLVEAATSASEA